MWLPNCSLGECCLYIFFDIDGTLVDHDFASSMACRDLRARHLQFMSLSEVEFCSLWFHVIADFMNQSQSCSFKEQSLSFTKEFFSRFGCHLNDEEATQEFETYIEVYRHHWRLYADVSACLNALTWLQLGIISNGDQEFQLDKLNALGICRQFSPIVLSTKVGVRKPDAAIFAEASRLANAPPNECMYIGDNLEADVLGSMAAGWQAIWLNRSKQAINNVLSISSLLELPSVLCLLDIDSQQRQVPLSCPTKAQRVSR